MSDEAISLKGQCHEKSMAFCFVIYEMLTALGLNNEPMNIYTFYTFFDPRQKASIFCKRRPHFINPVY